MELNGFSTNCLNKFFNNISKEQKSVFLQGDFDFNLNPTNKSLDSLASNSFVTCILQQTGLTSHSKTLIDNLFLNVISPEAICGNFTPIMSDHLPQLMIAPNVLCNSHWHMANIFERD